MYNEETKTFSFPYDQERIDAVCFIAESEIKFHNAIIAIRNVYIDEQIKKRKNGYRLYYRKIRWVNYWDKLIDTSREKIAQTACVLLNHAELVVKENKHVT